MTTKSAAPIGASILAGCALAMSAIAPAPAAGESGAAEAQLRSLVLKAVATVAGLPTPAQAGLARLFGQAKLDMADPGAEWQVTDVVTRPDLPGRRLVAAGCSNEYCLIYYERGGIAHVRTVVLLRLGGSGADLVQGWTAPGGLGSINQVQQAISEGRLRSQARFW